MNGALNVAGASTLNDTLTVSGKTTVSDLSANIKNDWIAGDVSLMIALFTVTGKSKLAVTDLIASLTDS